MQVISLCSSKKISVLENNNAKLVDENMTLKLENAELKGFIRGKAQPFEGETDRGGKKSQGSKVKMKND